MKKSISFSLFGNHEMYNVGLGENIRLANEIYCDYDIHIYYNNSVDSNLLALFSDKAIFHHVEYTDVPGYFWRFFLVDDKQYDIVLSRDLDSRISLREKAAVDQWIESGKTLHIMRDHEQHGHLILAGMWGIRPKMVHFSIMDSIINFARTYTDIHKKISDQIFLQRLFAIFQSNTLAHDNWFRCNNSIRFPVDRVGPRFIGEVYDGSNNPKYVYSEAFL